MHVELALGYLSFTADVEACEEGGDNTMATKPTDRHSIPIGIVPAA